MAQITMVFEGFQEMVEFAKNLMGVAGSTEVVQPALSKEEKKIPYGQQIAPHFPGVNGGGSVPEQTVATAQAQSTPAPQQPVQAQTPSSVPTQAVTTTKQTYTLDDLASAAMTLMDKGMQAQLMELLTSYGVEALPQLPPSRFGEFATALRGMGAQI